MSDNQNKQPQRLTDLSADGTTINLDALYQIAPSVFTEAPDPQTGEVQHKVDFDALRALLGDSIAEPDDECYRFTWVGKNDARLQAVRPTDKTLRPIQEDSADWDTTHNLYIEGDNLEVLKLLQRSYNGSVKMIYIDPPYNTGNDFVYHDSFARSAKDEDLAAGNIDDEGNRYRRNSDTNGRFHSDWCSMIYPRLILARNLLSDDGVIFMSISDEEYQNLKKICDEIFGENNFCGDILWNSTKSVTNTALISVSHTYNLVYFKNIDHFVENRADFRLPDNGEGFENPDNDPRGPWKADPFQVGGWRPNQQYEIVNPKTNVIYKPNPGCSWKNDFGKFQELVKDNRIVFGKTGDGGPQRKRFIWEAEERGKVVKTWWDDVETTTNGTQLLKKIFDGRSLFDNPKPLGLVKKMLQLGTNGNGVILDFFSGSATTAHAVMQLNAEDGGNRRFIMVQLPEPTAEESEAFKAGYKNICEIGKERIRRAAAQIRKEKSKEEPNLFTNVNNWGGTEAPLDLGFRVFRLDDSNYAPVKINPDDEIQGNLWETLPKADRSNLDLLFGAMLSWGITLDKPVQTTSVQYPDNPQQSFTIYNVNEGQLVACLDRMPKTDDSAPTTDPIEVLATAMAKIDGCTHYLLRDDGFNDDNQKINLLERFKTLKNWNDTEVLKNVRVI